MSRTHLFSLIRPRPTGVGGPDRHIHLTFFCFSCLRRKRKKVAERREIPFPFCHTPLFALYSRGPPFFFLCPWCSFVFPVHWMCIPKVLMWTGRPRSVRAWLVYTCTMETPESGLYFRAGQDLGAWETEITYIGHLLDVAVLSSDVLFPHISLHLHSLAL